MGFNISDVFKVDDYMHFYSKFLTEERTKKEVDNIISLLAPKPSQKIIDIACGHGRHSIELSKRGFDVTGVDIMEDFLAIARKEAKRQKTNVSFLKKDMRNLNFKEDFDIALLLFTSFGYFSDEENKTILKNVHRTLKHGGKLLFDIPNRDSRATLFKESVLEVDNDLMIDFPKFNPLNGRLKVRRLIIRDNQKREFTYEIRIYNLTEINELLLSAGFKLLEVYGNWEKEKFTATSPRIIIIAEKQ
ncbi:class I SAM-dependent methyltransferase [Thermosipho ferrireducens]|uniref:Class I SAM-dependent methyltransferase n=1 Tax=Thermosipho ferrireducens TaxID=2571116 RepID=A0ABX7S972_9BACT|nr:class I SAM-dependent methyltransferase [Thermosipho ferrireducens]QTA38420.1 class I SAM-dependent methyltransferase [Thermosipho ferrireducens]